MKKTIIIFSAFLMLACSSSDENTTSESKNQINIPTWLIGLYQADYMFVKPYPQSHPYSINFSSNDIIVKGTSKSETTSMKTFIDSLKTADKLISVNETSEQNHYKIIIEYKTSTGSSNKFLYEINPVEGLKGKISIDYYHLVDSGAYDEDAIRYTKQ